MNIDQLKDLDIITLETLLQNVSHVLYDKKHNSGNVCLIAKSPYDKEEKVMVPKEKFMERFYERAGEFIDDKFNWDNVIVAGGLISGLLESKVDMDLYTDSTIDIFVYEGNNYNNKFVEEKMMQIYKYLTKNLDGKFFSYTRLYPQSGYYNYNNVIVITIPDKCVIKIFGVWFKNELSVIQSFDLSHCQVGFNGRAIIYTPEFEKAIASRITKPMVRYVQLYRLMKAYQRGYSIEKPTNSHGSIENFFQKEGEDSLCCEFNSDRSNLEEALQDPLVIKNLARHYIPSIKSLNNTKSVETEIDKIKASINYPEITFVNCYGFENDIFDSDEFDLNDNNLFNLCIRRPDGIMSDHNIVYY